MVAIARLRYRAVVAASAIPITRGNCRDGSANRVVSGATASQPTNDSISVVAACPTDSQPCGANGVQLASRAEVADPVTATTTTPISRLTRTSCARSARPQAAGREREHDQQQHRGDGGPGQHAAAGEAGDVARPDEAHDGSAADDGGQERPPGHQARARAETRGDVPRDTARRGNLPAQGREHGREQARQAQQAEPGEDRRRARLRGGEARQEQEAGPEQGADIERGAARCGQVLRSCARRGRTAGETSLRSCRQPSRNGLARDGKYCPSATRWRNVVARLWR